MAQPVNIQFERFFTKKAALESVIPYYDAAPNLNLEMTVGEIKYNKPTNQSGVVDGSTRYAVELNISVNAVSPEKKVQFTISATQVGLVQVNSLEVPAGFDIFMANYIAPYLAATISDIAAKSGYPQVTLPPLTFNQQTEQAMPAANNGSPLYKSIN